MEKLLAISWSKCMLCTIGVPSFFDRSSFIFIDNSPRSLPLEAFMQ